MGNIPPIAARPAARWIGSLALTWEIAVRRGISSALLLMLEHFLS
jgi:hypothetical protein